jgi:hypothetical protein
VKSSRKSLLAKIANALAALCFVGVFALWEEYAFTRPTFPQPSQGRTYDLNTHGHIVFLTLRELSSLYMLGLIGVAFLIAALAIINPGGNAAK